MSFEGDKTPHRIRYGALIARIKSAYGKGNDIAVAEDVETLKSAMENHIEAKLAWDHVNTDDTMIHLIATWARVSRIMYKLDEKYD